MTMTTARPIASLNPLRKTAPSADSSISVSQIGWSTQCGANGLWMMCSVASAAESVMVITKSVAANPSRIRTRALPRQRGSSCSRSEMLPWPCGLSAAMRR